MIDYSLALELAIGPKAYMWGWYIGCYVEMLLYHIVVLLITTFLLLSSFVESLNAINLLLHIYDKTNWANTLRSIKTAWHLQGDTMMQIMAGKLRGVY